MKPIEPNDFDDMVISMDGIAAAVAKTPQRKSDEKGHLATKSYPYEDPHQAMRSVTLKGYEIIAPVHRRRRHFEILGRSGGGKIREFWVRLDGKPKCHKAEDARMPKWLLSIIASPQPV